jgi:hypothetical protein
MKRASKVVVLVLGAAAAGYMSWWWYRVSHYSEWVSRISIGETEERVLAVVGRPVMANTSPGPMWCDGPDIAHEYMYGAAVFASWDVIGFNKDGKVVCKQELRSP